MRKGNAKNEQTDTYRPEGNVAHILKKGRYGVLRVIFSRAGVMLLMMLVQLAVLFGMYFVFRDKLTYSSAVMFVFRVVMVLCLLSSRSDPTSKITWLVIIIMFPIFGTMLYAYTRSEIGHRALKKRLDAISRESGGALEQNAAALDALAQTDGGAASLAGYLYSHGGFPVFEATQVTYLPGGEAMLDALLCELESAESFIYMEYFTVEEGYMWGRILEILLRKAEAGVDVRVLIDGTCEVTTLSTDYAARLRSRGISCKSFNHVTPFLSTHYNYRDHRKITVIDGRVAFNGGVNLTDEYINRRQRFGHWKDAAVMLRGDAVESFTYMFMQMWEADEKERSLRGALPMSASCARHGEGFVIPYGDRPLDADKVGERVYMDILNRARRYVHIMTPYLILDGEMESAIKFASERGVEVVLMLPGTPDKRIPYALAKTHYASLLSSGVRIYEYTPGFLHSKVFVSDDREAVVGTVNLDYRSFYHHFECATYMFGVPCIHDIEEDYQRAVAKCRAVVPETLKKEKLSVKLCGILFKAIAPLL